jgi:hypothetical protein
VPNGRRIALDISEEGGERVPAVLLLPANERAPAALLLHGYGSHKDQMAETVGRALLARGVASLAIDLPMHGERADPMEKMATQNPMALVGRWKAGQADALLAIGYLAARREIDRERIALVGYSMGSFLGVEVAARSPRVKALVLAAGGDLPSQTPFARLVRTFADPLRAVRKLDGRPLLMVHGRRDSVVRPEQAQRLFDAALEPKELRWWDSGHVVPVPAIAEAAGWVASHV